MNSTVLLVEDDANLRATVEEVLRADGYEVVPVGTGAEALERFEAVSPELTLLDLGLPDISGMEVLSRIMERWPEALVLMLTADDSVEAAVTATKLGAEDYLTKPLKLERFRTSLRLAEEKLSMRRRMARMVRDRTDEPFVGKAPAIGELLRIARRVASQSDPPTVLITGETGTGKELLAKRIHACGVRAREPFFGQSCANLQEETLEATLFGFCRGAFTGATSDQPGLLELAGRGTLFLDEVGEMSLDLQAKFLRVLEERRFRRLGDHRQRDLQAHIVTATNRNLASMVRQGRFRSDLYYRLYVLPLHIPPLRERPGDVRLLLDHFVAQFAAKFGVDVRGFDRDATEVLCAYHWPGNVRELRNMVERILILWGGGEWIRLRHLPPEVRQGRADEGEMLRREARLVREGPGAGAIAGRRNGSSPVDLRSLEEVELEHLLRVYRHTGGNKTQTARILRITRQTVQKKLEKAVQQGMISKDECAADAVPAAALSAAVPR